MCNALIVPNLGRLLHSITVTLQINNGTVIFIICLHLKILPANDVLYEVNLPSIEGLYFESGLLYREKPPLR